MNHPPPPPQMTGRSLRRFARPAAAVAAAMALIIAYVPALPAMAQAQRGAIASVSLASDAAGQLVITWEAPESAPTDYRIAWANAELDWLSYSADNEDERGNAYPLVGVTTLTLDGLTPGDTYKVQMRSRYYNANRTVHEQSGPWTDVMTQRVNTAPPEPESEETTGGQTEAATEERSKGQTVLDRASAVPKSDGQRPPGVRKRHSERQDAGDHLQRGSGPGSQGCRQQPLDQLPLHTKERPPTWE